MPRAPCGSSRMMFDCVVRDGLAERMSLLLTIKRLNVGDVFLLIDIDIKIRSADILKFKSLFCDGFSFPSNQVAEGE